jgi:hypothetical protein
VELLKSRDLFGLAHLSLRHRIDLTVDAEKNPKTRNALSKSLATSAEWQSKFNEHERNAETPTASGRKLV